MRARLSLFALAVVQVAFAGSDARAEPTKLEVLHNISAQTQQPALQVLIDAMKERGVQWVDSSYATGAAARAAMVHRAAAGDPAAVMFVHSKLLFRELTARGLTTTVQPNGWESWKDKVPESLWSEMTDDQGKVLFTPIIVGAHNVAFFNTGILRKAGVQSVPSTWDELMVALDKMKAVSGIVPLAFTETPVQVFQTFHNLVAGLGGRSLYQRIFVDKDVTALRTPEFRKVAKALGSLKQYTDPGRSSRVWQDAAMMVASGRAGAMVYGTFALQPFIVFGKTPGIDFACSNLGGVAILGPNGFMYGKPANEAQHEAQNRFAEMVMDPEVQTLFVEAYGGIPSRLDADRSTLNDCMLSTGPALADPMRSVKDPSLTMDGRMIGAIQDAVVEFWANGGDRSEPFIADLTGAMSGR